MKEYIRVNETLESTLEQRMSLMACQGWEVVHIGDNGPRYATMSREVEAVPVIKPVRTKKTANTL